MLKNKTDKNKWLASQKALISTQVDPSVILAMVYPTLSKNCSILLF